MMSWDSLDIVDNMSINFSLTAGSVENPHFLWLWEVSSLPNFIVIPKTPLYKGMVVEILN